MSIKLLCIDQLEDFSLIDTDYLNSIGIEAYFLFTKGDSSNTKNCIKINKYDFNNIFTAARSLSPDRIVCFSEELFITVARVQNKLKIKGMSQNSAKVFSNKFSMYNKLDGHIKVPKTTLLSRASSYIDLVCSLGIENIFIKPVACSGSFETYHVRDQASYDTFINHKKLNLDKYIAQEYIAGELYHVETIVEGGNVKYKSARKYSAPNNSMLENEVLLYSMPIYDPEVESELLEKGLLVQQKLDVQNAVMHTEFFKSTDTGQLVFIETNMRAPGIGLNKMYKKLLGISFETIMCLLVCKVSIPRFNVSKKMFVCGYYPRKKGVVKKINKPNLNIDCQWEYFTNIGDETKELNSMTKAAMVLCSDFNREKLKTAIEYLSSYQVIETV